ncbi:MAG: hypothetical protein NTY48_01230 [Candidatus Diapherotrites archaeon]|nr:hypothetical protein [Candidatus Diapherotrites archaeon]
MFSQIAAMFAAFVPKSIIEKNVRPALVYAGSKDDVRQWIGIRVLVTILIFAIMFLIPFGALPAFALLFSIDFLYLDFFSRLLFAIILGLIGAVTTSVIFYIHLFYVIDGRKKMVENILPDFFFFFGNNLT